MGVLHVFSIFSWWWVKVLICLLQTGNLAMESLLSLTSRRAGEWFKEELRTLGALDHIVDTGQSGCSSILQSMQGFDQICIHTCTYSSFPCFVDIEVVIFFFKFVLLCFIYTREWMGVFYFFGLVHYKEIIWIWNGFNISILHIEYSKVGCWFVVNLSVCSCIEALGDDTTLVTDSMLENMKKIDRCLRVLENVRYLTYKDV